MSRATISVLTGLSVVLVVGARTDWTLAGDQGCGPDGSTVAVQASSLYNTLTVPAGLAVPAAIGVDFTTPGIVSEIDVKAGQVVQKGQVLAKLDDAAATRALRAAKAQVTAAEGGLLSAKAQIRQARGQAWVAAQSVRNSDIALRQAWDRLHLDRATLDEILGGAKLQLHASERDVSRARTRADSSANATQTAQVPPATPTTTLSSTRQRSSQASVTVSTDRTVIASAYALLTIARRSRSATLLADAQQIESLAAARVLADRSARAAAGGIPVSKDGKKFGPILLGKANLEQAKIGVETAQAALDATVLRAPVTGPVSSVTGAVGKTSVNYAAQASAQSGFVVLTDLTHLAVVAAVPESQVGRVQVGQQTLVTFPQTGKSIAGTVAAIDPQRTGTAAAPTHAVRVDLVAGVVPQDVSQSASVVITNLPRLPIVVPTGATTLVGNQALVTVRRAGTTIKIPVSVAPVGDGTSKVDSPLFHDGDLIVVPPGACPRTPAPSGAPGTVPPTPGQSQTPTPSASPVVIPPPGTEPQAPVQPPALSPVQPPAVAPVQPQPAPQPAPPVLPPLQSHSILPPPGQTG